MNKFLAIIYFMVPLFISVALFPHGAIALLVAVPFVVSAVLLIKKSGSDQSAFLIQLFLAAFFVRVLCAAFIESYSLRMFFGEDSFAHEGHGLLLSQEWAGLIDLPPELTDWNRPWGLHYMIAFIYTIIGQNALAISFISAFAGAASSVLIFLCTRRIFKNAASARFAAIMAAFSPAMIIWSSQILKDGFVVFFVVLTIYSLTRLQERFSWFDVAVLMISLLGIFSIRFYVFYFASIACVGSFFFGSKRVLANGMRWLVILSIFVVIAGYAGLLTVGNEQVEQLTDLESLQYSREVLSREAGSGYGAATDITTSTGALLALPVGLLNLLLAPFPWQMGSLRSMLPLPEMLVWWSLIPFGVIGVKYTLKHRFREAIPMVLFTLTLTIAYALFQTNVGTAYRQRTQVQIFLFIFISVGLAIFKERREDRRALKAPVRRMQAELS